MHKCCEYGERRGFQVYVTDVPLRNSSNWAPARYRFKTSRGKLRSSLSAVLAKGYKLLEGGAEAGR